jgi:hypothetical protein
MIPALLLRFGIPKWIAMFAMFAMVAAGALTYRHHLIQQGVSLESARRDRIEAENSARADGERSALNELLRVAQAKLAAAIADLSKKEMELSNEKIISSQRQLDLLAGRERMRVLTHPRPADQAGSPGSTAAAGVDQGASVESDLDPRVASDLEWARETRNEAITRLGACVVAYDAVKAASDAP